jgi:hypothetical protein
VSVDAEKDRKTKDLDELLTLCDIVFTNSQYLKTYLARLEMEKEKEACLLPLPVPTIISMNGGNNGLLDKKDAASHQIYANALVPSAFFTRWYHEPDHKNKHVIVTQ